MSLLLTHSSIITHEYTFHSDFYVLAVHIIILLYFPFENSGPFIYHVKYFSISYFLYFCSYICFCNTVHLAFLFFFNLSGFTRGLES